MEHTEFDIKCIDFGNKALDLYLKNEKLFLDMINTSKPYRFCINSAYPVLVKLGELPEYWKAKNTELVQEARIQAQEWATPLENEAKVDDIARIVLILNALAEKRL